MVENRGQINFRMAACLSRPRLHKASCACRVSHPRSTLYPLGGLNALLPSLSNRKSEENRISEIGEGSNWPKKDQKSTKTGQRVPQKQAKLEDPLENEEAAEATQGSRAIQADRAIRPGLANQPTATLEKKSPKLKTEVIEERATRYARTGAI